MVALSSISVMPEVDAMFAAPVYKLSDFARSRCSLPIRPF